MHSAGAKIKATGGPSLKESAQRWWLALLLVVGMIFCYAQRGAMSVAGPFMAKELKLSRTELGVLMSAFSWCYSFMQVPGGWVVDRFGVRRAYALGYLLWSVVTGVTGAARTMLEMIPFRILTGIGQAVAFPASARAVANWFHDRERGSVTGAYLTGVRLGQALINWGGALLAATYGWKLLFLVSGVVPLIWLLPWMQFLGKWERAPQTPAGSRPSAVVSFFRSFALLRFRTVFGIFLGFFAFDYVWFVFVNWLPGYLRMERKFSAQEMSTYSSVPFLVMSVVILASGVLSDWLIRRGYSEVRVRKTLIAIGLVVAGAIVPAGLVQDKVTAVWLLTLSLCGLGITSPNTWTLTQAVCSKNVVGTVSGIQNFGGNVGGILAPALTGWIADHASFAAAFWLAGVILLVGILSYWLIISKRVDVELS